MLNLQICTVIIMTKKQHKIIIIIKKIINKFMRFPRFEPGIHGLKVHKISTTLWRHMHFIDKNKQYVLKL